MPATTDPVLETVVHRALASPTRSRLLAELRAAGRPMSAQELGAVTDLHANTVRTHLAILENARLVVASREGGGRRGRPRHLFAATDARPADDEAYRALAAVLAERLGQDRAATWEPGAPGARDTEAAVEEAAISWVQRRFPQAVHACEETPGLERVLHALEELGFGSRVRGDLGRGAVEVVVEDCPFTEIVRTHPEVACGFHRGVVRGLVHAAGDLEVVHITENRDADRCIAAVRSTR
jgi:predicted ArsR family transcriptional regulator